MITVVIIAAYLVLLLGLGLFSSRFFRGTAADFFLASRGIGSFLLLMSLFGTTMTAFALVGSTGEAFASGIGVYGKLASSSGIVHSLCFFLVGIKLWSIGARHGYLTQIQFFRDRFDSDKLGLALFPILVGLVIPYLLIGILGAGATLKAVTQGTFPALSADGSLPFALGAGIICVVVLIYVFFGGVRGTAWANCFQTIVFILLGIVTFFALSSKLGGMTHATQRVVERNPTKLQRAVHPDDQARYEAAVAAHEEGTAAGETELAPPRKPHGISQMVFFTYLLIPLSVGMFPHIFQHWLTARSAQSFKLAVVAHPLLIMLVWVPCILIGTWATSAVIDGASVIPPGANPNAVLAIMVDKLTHPILGGFLTAGILAAIMSSLDSQFLCLSSIFSNDIYVHYVKKGRVSDRQKVLLGRVFVCAVVLVTYLIAVKLEGTRGIFTLGVWCFSGFSALFPLVVAALYWRRATRAGAFACIGATAAAWLWLFAQSDFGANRAYTFLGMMPVATLVAVSALVLIVVSLMTRPPGEDTLRKFFPAGQTG